MQIKTVLEQYGLKERHAEVYLACLELGSASIQKISQKSGLARSTCEAVLDSLHEKGFVTTFRKKNVRYFSPEDPKKLINLAKQKVALLEGALPQFSARYFKSGLLPTVRLYEGNDGIKIVLQEILNEASELRSFGSVEDVTGAIPDFFEQFSAERAKKAIPIKIILKDSPLARARQSTGAPQLREIRLVPSDYEISSITYIWGGKVTMISLKEQKLAFVIESDEMAAVQCTMFESIWRSLGSEATL